jgi:hypothetical protein
MIYLRTPLGTLYAQALKGDDTGPFPHPEGKRWGWWKDGGEVCLYAGRMMVIVTPRGWAPAR